MQRITTITALLITIGLPSFAQQFVGMQCANFTNVQQMPYNPAFVAHSQEGTEINLSSISATIGNNAYRFDKGWLTGGFSDAAIEGKDYTKLQNERKKYLWGNIDVLGPAAAIKLNSRKYIGFYSRMRQLTNAGNLNKDAFQFFGTGFDYAAFGKSTTISNAGSTIHNWAEVGATYGGIIKDDGFHTWKGGVTVKYLMGMTAGTIFTSSTTLNKHTADSINSLNGDLTVAYTDNIKPFIDNDFSNDIPNWFNRAGKGGIGLDVGLQYEYHPDFDPNREDNPYLYSIAVSICDIGSIQYGADTGSGIYQMRIKNAADYQYKRMDYEPMVHYLDRLVKDSFLVKKSDLKSFTVSLPTNFRAQFDVNLMGKFYLMTNVLLNLRSSNGGIYNPGYANMLSLTPRYEDKYMMVAMPFSYVGHQNFNIGLALRAGPLFVGSSSILSNNMVNKLQSIDMYAGLTLKLKKKERIQSYMMH